MDDIRNDTRNRFEGISWKFWKKRRYILAMLVFCGLFNNNMFRVNLSMAIVDMTEVKNVTLLNGTVVCVREFDWDTKVQGYALSSFFYGYIITSFIGGYLSMRFGGAKVFGIGVATTAVLTLITPWVVKISVYLFMAARILEGIFEGVSLSCVYEIWSKWAPPLERSRLLASSLSGFYLAPVVALPCSGLLISSFGWSSVFYSCGILGLLWYLIWISIATDTPQQDTKISNEELKYITESLNITGNEKRTKIPWKAILTSRPVWAIVITCFCDHWGFFTLLTQLPKFMKRTLKFDMKDTGILSALPYLVLSITVQLFSQFADWFQVKGFFTTTQVRKIFSCSGLVAQMVFMLGAAFWRSPAGTTFCLTMAVGLGGVETSGHVVSMLDIAPYYAGIISGFAVTFVALGGAISPILSGYIVTNENNAEEWRKVFYISAGIYLSGALIYGTFGSGDLQPWAVDNEKLTRNRHEEEEKAKLRNN